MASVYRIIVENKEINNGYSISSNGEILPKKGSSKGSGLKNGILTGKRGGVEHNRYMRPINPLLNRYTGGVWEKSLRFGRAMSGLITTGSLVGASILLQFGVNALDKTFRQYKKRVEQNNNSNFLQMKYGVNTINEAYSVSKNIITGKITYKSQK
jgi:hypothetical protein